MDEQPRMSPPQAGIPEYEYAEPAARSIWPAVVGGISIALGIVGIVFYGVCPFLGAVIGQAFAGGQAGMGEVSDEIRQQLEDVEARYAAWGIVNQIAGTGLALMLLIAGIGLVRRRQWSRMTAIAWALIKLLFMISTAVHGFLAASAAIEVMSGDPELEDKIGMIQAASFALLGFTIFFVSAYPIFNLIWFARPKIKDEVAMWL